MCAVLPALPSRTVLCITRLQAASSASTCPSSASHLCRPPPYRYGAPPLTPLLRTRSGRMAFPAQAAARPTVGAPFSPRRASHTRTLPHRAKGHTRAMGHPGAGRCRPASHQCRRPAAARRTRTRAMATASPVPAWTAANALGATSQRARMSGAAGLPTPGDHRRSGRRQCRPRTGLPMEPRISPTLRGGTPTKPTTARPPQRRLQMRSKSHNVNNAHEAQIN